MPVHLQASAAAAPRAHNLHQNPGRCAHGFRRPKHTVLPQEFGLELHDGCAADWSFHASSLLPAKLGRADEVRVAVTRAWLVASEC